MALLSIPQGLYVRSPSRDDAEIVAALGQICDQVDRGFSSISVESVLRGWSLPGVDLSQDGWLIFTPSNQLVAYIILNRMDLPQLYATARVHPDYRHLGLDAYLLVRAEEYARQLIARAPADARVALNTFCPEKNQRLRQVIEEAGFVYTRGNWRMEIDMGAPPSEPVWPDGIELRPFTLDMARAVHAVDEEAFSDHWGHMPASFELFERWFLKDPSFDPTLWFVPFEGEQIVGCAFCEYRGETGWVGSLSVRRPWRRKGVALALLHRAFGEFYRRGTRIVGLDVDAQSLTGATHLYENAGMHVVCQDNQFQKELRAGVELSTQALDI